MSDIDFSKLLPTELYWRDHYEWLLDQGYQLLPRYHPEWKPSWNVEDKVAGHRAEDGQFSTREAVNCATRLSDGRVVMLKRLDLEDYEELQIMTALCRGSAASDPKNHCVPILDILQPPPTRGEDGTLEDSSLVVMPLLRRFDDPNFVTVGEAVDFICQFFEAIQYLHENNIAYRDISVNNIMMDGSELFTEKWHPFDQYMKLDFTGPIEAKYTRTERSPKYYLIDFGLSRRYNRDSESPPRETLIQGTDLTVPEWNAESGPPPHYDPFAVDVYCLGNFLRTNFVGQGKREKSSLTGGRHGLGFLRPLVERMVHSDPSQRPDITVSVNELQRIVRKLPWWKLRARCVERGDFEQDSDWFVGKVVFGVLHWSLQFRNMARLRPAMPPPRPLPQQES